MTHLLKLIPLHSSISFIPSLPSIHSSMHPSIHHHHHHQSHHHLIIIYHHTSSIIIIIIIFINLINSFSPLSASLSLSQLLSASRPKSGPRLVLFSNQLQPSVNFNFWSVPASLSLSQPLSGSLSLSHSLSASLSLAQPLSASLSFS